MKTPACCAWNQHWTEITDSEPRLVQFWERPLNSNTFATVISILAKFWIKCSKSDQGWSGDLVWSPCMCSMYVCATLLSSAVDNLILIVLCSCQLRETVYCHCPLPWHMPSSLPLPLHLIVSSLLDVVTPTWRPDRSHPPASWIINILSVCCQYPSHIKWTRTNMYEHIHMWQQHMLTTGSWLQHVMLDIKLNQNTVIKCRPVQALPMSYRCFKLQYNSCCHAKGRYIYCWDLTSNSSNSANDF